MANRNIFQVPTDLADVRALRRYLLLVNEELKELREFKDTHTSYELWDDVVGSLIGKQLYSTAGTLDYDYAENAILMGPNGGITDQNDVLVFNLQHPHGAKPDSSMHLHIHWEQTDTTDREFTVEWRVQSNGLNKHTTWNQEVVSTGTGNVHKWHSGTLNQITELVEVPLFGAGMSATVQFRITRSDAVAGDIRATFIDAHVLYNTDGSIGEYNKY